MPTQELYHGTNGDNVLHILRGGWMHPRDGKIFFCKQESQLGTLFQHGADVSREASFAIKVKVHIPSREHLTARSTPGVLDTWVLATPVPVKAEVEALFVRPRGATSFETITGPTEINNFLQIAGRRVHPVFRSALHNILRELKRLGWQPYIDNIVRSSSEQAEKLRKGYSKTMKSWHVQSTMATLPRGRDALDVVLGNAADIVDARFKWTGPAANPDYEFWKDLGSTAKHFGCGWGGDWKMKDVAHVQLLFIEGAPQTTATA